MKSMKLIFSLILLLLSDLLYAFDFSSESAGRTFYFNIIDSVDYKVSVTYPGPCIDSAYLNYVKPSGDLVIPSEVSYNGQKYLVTEIESCAFAKCTGLNGKLEIPNTVTKIGSYAFLHCGNISALRFNCEQCTSAFAAFEGCAFNDILLGEDVILLPDGIFSNSSNISRIQLPESVRRIGTRAFYNCPNLERIDFNDSIVSIGDFAFSNCPLLGSINHISANVVGRYAFFGSRVLRSLTIGSDVHEIADYAFFMANSVDTIYCMAPTPPSLGEHAFSQLLQSTCLVVGCDVVDLYQSTPGWDAFPFIIADQTYTLEAIASQPDYGFVTGSGGGHCFGEVISIEAVPYYGFVFQAWNDGVEDNPRDIIIQCDTLVIAQFAANPFLGFEENVCYSDARFVTIGNTIHVFVSCPTIFQIFDVMGRCFYCSTSKENSLTCTLPFNGVYIVAYGDGFVKKIVK